MDLVKSWKKEEDVNLIKNIILEIQNELKPDALKKLKVKDIESVNIRAYAKKNIIKEILVNLKEYESIQKKKINLDEINTRKTYVDQDNIVGKVNDIIICESDIEKKDFIKVVVIFKKDSGLCITYYACIDLL